MAEIIVPPTTRPAPKWKQSPYVTCRKGTFTLHYELELEGAQDASLICWELEQDGERRTVSVSRPGVGNRAYHPGNEAIGAAVYVRITPRTNCSACGETIELCARERLEPEGIEDAGRVQTDLRISLRNFSPGSVRSGGRGISIRPERRLRSGENGSRSCRRLPGAIVLLETAAWAPD